MRRLAAAAIAIVAAGVVATAVFATGGGDANALTVELDEWGLATSTARVQAGEVDLTQRNTGRLEHELLIVRTAVGAADLPIGLSGVRPSLAGRIVFGAEHSHHEGAGRPAGAEHLAPGETRRGPVRLRPGRYVLLCGIDDHYEAGQRGTLSVE